MSTNAPATSAKISMDLEEEPTSTLTEDARTLGRLASLPKEKFLSHPPPVESGQASEPTATPAPRRVWDDTEDRRPAKLCPVGSRLKWSMPTVFNSESIAAVMSTAPSLQEPSALSISEPPATVSSSSEARFSSEQTVSPGQAQLSKSPSNLTELYSRGLTGLTSAWPKRPVARILQLPEASAGSATLAGTSDNKSEEERQDNHRCRPLPGQVLRLDKLLASSFDIPSQVWVCTVEPHGSTVILKLLTNQAAKAPSNVYFPPEVYESFDFSKGSLGRNAQMHLSKECDRLKSLAPLQGTCVPYSFGFYEFELPSGVTAVGHVMEYIPNQKIRPYFDRFVKPYPDLVHQFYTSFVSTFVELHRHDVAQQDIGLRNILLHPTVDNAFRFTIVDFTMAVSIRYLEAIGADWLSSEEDGLEGCLEDELDADSFILWQETEQGKALWSLVTKGPDELAALKIHSGGSTSASFETAADTFRSQRSIDSSTELSAELSEHTSSAKVTEKPSVTQYSASDPDPNAVPFPAPSPIPTLSVLDPGEDSSVRRLPKLASSESQNASARRLLEASDFAYIEQEHTREPHIGLESHGFTADKFTAAACDLLPTPDENRLSSSNESHSSSSASSGHGFWNDRRPAKLAAVGTILAWESPSLFNTASLVAVLTAAPVTTVQVFPSGTADDVHAAEEDYDSDDGAPSSVGDLGTEDGVKEEAHPAGNVDVTKAGMQNPSEVGRSFDNASLAPQRDAVDFEVDWPKRSALPLLQFLDETGSAPAVAIGSVTKITQCRPVPGSSLRLDKLLAAGRDTPSQVWKATVQPTGYTVVLKLLTDQAGPKYPPNTRVPREEYEDCMDFEKASLGRTKQHDISRDADAFEALSLMQGTRVPYSYGYYSFELHDGKKTQVLGHVMEYVPSINIPRLFHKVIKHNERLIDAFYTSLFRTFTEIHRHDVCHQNAGLRNMLLYPNGINKYQIVLIDLTLARSITFSEKLGCPWGHAEEVAFQRCLEAESDAQMFWDWKKTDKGKLLWDEFHRGPRRFLKVTSSALEVDVTQAESPGGRGHSSSYDSTDNSSQTEEPNQVPTVAPSPAGSPTPVDVASRTGTADTPATPSDARLLSQNGDPSVLMSSKKRRGSPDFESSFERSTAVRRKISSDV